MKSAISNTTLSARGCPWNKKKKYISAFGFPRKLSVNLVQPFGQLYIYERRTLFYRFLQLSLISCDMLPLLQTLTK